MASLLSQLLNEPEPTLSRQLEALEQGAGNPAVDVRLGASLRQQAIQKILSLGLDPDDTTAAELYWTLKNKALQDEAQLHSRLGLTSENYAEAVTGFLRDSLTAKSWVLKRSVAKTLLQAHPPSKAMKFLKYRSCASMLKNCVLEEIWMAASWHEDEKWWEGLAGDMVKLTATDFEYRPVSIVTLYEPVWNDLLPQMQKMHITAAQNMLIIGSIVVIPYKLPLGNGQATALDLLITILRSYNELREFLSFIHFHQIHANFGAFIVEAPDLYNRPVISIAGVECSWKHLIGALQYPGSGAIIETFEPRITAQDTELINVEALLLTISLGFDWWLKTVHLGAIINDSVVSFNLSDICDTTMLSDDGHYEVVLGMRSALKTELLAQYILSPAYIRQVIEQLDNLDLQPHTTTISGKTRRRSSSTNAGKKKKA